MRHDIVGLREVSLPAGSAGEGMEWMTLAQAQAARVRLDGLSHSVGPLRRGVVYKSGYWGHVSTVHEVFVRVAAHRVRGRFAGRRACGYEVVEQNAGDLRPRRHCTAWEYGRGNQALFTIEG